MGIQGKILIADDSITVRNTLEMMLSGNEQGNYEVTMATNGREACTMAYHNRPDLILIDIEMPVMNGIDAIRKIKGNTLIKRIPIIVMSSTKQFQDAFDAGADDFLVKPFNKYELLLRIQFNLNLAKARSENRKQHELLKTQKQEAITQRDTILRQKADLIDDLKYARFVQNAILPSSSYMNMIFSDHFIYHRPKNIVSGDFYWATRKKDLCIVAVGDCTGHGMSGALMTMAGAAFLNEIVGRLHSLTSDGILNDLRKKVIQFLNQKGEIGEASNGMDIALCIYNQTNKTIQFSGANNFLYLMKKGEPLEAFRGDRMPIGYFFDYDQPFTRREYTVSENDMIYLFTDGYPDQFGGPYEKKFRYSEFRELIEKASVLPMEEQKNLIQSTMEDWIEGYEQIDDIMVVGIKL